MKTVTLVALTGVALSSDHSYFRNPNRAPVKTESPALHKLENSLLIRRFEDEEFNFKKDFQKLDENAAQYDHRKHPDSKDDLEEDELEVLKYLIQNFRVTRQKTLHDPAYEDHELASGTNGRTDRPKKQKGRDFITFDDEELALIRPNFEPRHEVKFEEKEPLSPEFLKLLKSLQDNRGLKGSIKFDDDEFPLLRPLTQPRHELRFEDKEAIPAELLKLLKSFQDVRGVKGSIKFDDNELSIETSQKTSRAGAFSSHKQKPIKKDKEPHAKKPEAGSRAGGFSSRQSVSFDDEADNSLFDLGGLVKDGLNIYKDVKSHNYGDLIHHGKDAVSHIKNKKH